LGIKKTHVSGCEGNMEPCQCVRVCVRLYMCTCVWRADVVLCLLLRRTASCRCIMLQQTKPGQRWWQRCWTHTLTLQARLTRYVAGLMWGGVCLASACVLLCGSEMCGWEACTFSWIRAALPTFVQTDCLYSPKL